MPAAAAGPTDGPPGKEAMWQRSGPCDAGRNLQEPWLSLNKKEALPPLPTRPVSVQAGIAMLSPIGSNTQFCYSGNWNQRLKKPILSVYLQPTPYNKLCWTQEPRAIRQHVWGAEGTPSYSALIPWWHGCLWTVLGLTVSVCGREVTVTSLIQSSAINTRMGSHSTPEDGTASDALAGIDSSALLSAKPKGPTTKDRDFKTMLPSFGSHPG